MNGHEQEELGLGLSRLSEDTYRRLCITQCKFNDYMTMSHLDERRSGFPQLQLLAQHSAFD